MKHDEPTDLLSEARRRPLSREEEARLEELVEHSPEARILHYAGWTFDRDSSAREGDDVLVAKLAARAAERMAKPEAPRSIMRRRKRPLVTLLAAALVVAGTAGAGVGVVYFVRAPERVAELSPPADPNPASAAKSKVRRAAAAAPPAADPAPAVDPAPAPVVTPIGPAPTAAPAPASEPLAGARAPIVASVAPAPVSAPAPAFRSDPASKNPRDALSAPALFGQANQLRLAGDTRGAIVVYKLLSEHHPGSEEAKLAELSLGKLFLASGDASQALTHFRRAAESGGALGSEALWGEAGALRALGRTSEERSTLERLLREFPDGAYAKAARKRLGTDVP
jgi:TolA-binding protein